jgi:hypothetical protein
VFASPGSHAFAIVAFALRAVADRVARPWQAMAHSRMPWNSSYYPRSMHHLPEVVRAKAIEIANALLEEGYEEGRAIQIAIAKAKEWSERRGHVPG